MEIKVEKRNTEKYPFLTTCLSDSAHSRTRGTRRWEREETPLLGLHKPDGSGVRLHPAEVLGELPSFLFFLAVGIVISWVFEPLWEQAWYLCPTKTNRLAFVSAGCCRECKAPLPLHHTLLAREISSET